MKATLDAVAMEALLAWFREDSERAFILTHEHGQNVVRLRLGASAKGIEAKGPELGPAIVAALDAWQTWARVNVRASL